MRKVYASLALGLFLAGAGCSDEVHDEFTDSLAPGCDVDPLDILPANLVLGYECTGISAPPGTILSFEDWTESFDFAAAPRQIVLEFDPGSGTVACSYSNASAQCEKWASGDTIGLLSVVADPANDPLCPTTGQSPFDQVAPGRMLLSAITVINPNSEFLALTGSSLSLNMAISCTAQ